MAKITKSRVGINTDNDASIVEEALQAMAEEESKAKEEPKLEEVSFNEDLNQKSAVKFVKILPKMDHNCSIGGVRYFLKKGVQQNVPAEVKEVLMKSDLLMPL